MVIDSDGLYEKLIDLASIMGQKSSCEDGAIKRAKERTNPYVKSGNNVVSSLVHVKTAIRDIVQAVHLTCSCQLYNKHDGDSLIFPYGIQFVDEVSLYTESLAKSELTKFYLIILLGYSEYILLCQQNSWWDHRRRKLHEFIKSNASDSLKQLASQMLQENKIFANKFRPLYTPEQYLEQQEKLRALELPDLIERFEVNLKVRCLHHVPSKPEPSSFDILIEELELYLLKKPEVLTLEQCVLLLRVIEYSMNPVKKTSLTKRELEILGYTAIGKTAAEIAKRTFTGLSNINKHISNINRKFGVTNKAAAVFLAIILGIIDVIG